MIDSILKAKVLAINSPPFQAFGKWYVNVSYVSGIGNSGTIELPHNTYEEALHTRVGFEFTLTVTY
jgi:hypothetical protein